jgi:hypothetical protein
VAFSVSLFPSPGNNTDPYGLLADPGGMLTMSRRVSPRVIFSNSAISSP